MKLLESIDYLLMESPESLGFPKAVADEIRATITSSRKAQDHYARLFKDRAIVGSSDRMIYAPIDTEIERAMGDRADEFYEALGQKMGFKEEVRGNRIIKFAPYRLQVISDLLTLRKKALKALKVMNPSATNKRDKVEDIMDKALVKQLKMFAQGADSIVTFLNADPNNYRMIKGKDLDAASDIAYEENEKARVDESKVFITFPDGHFWYEVTDEECRLEGDKMGHCGRNTYPDSTMYSLRDSSNQPHVTIEYNAGNIIQLKGKGNDRPDDKYTKYIKEFIKKTDAHIEEKWGSEERYDYEVDEYLSRLTSRHGSYDYKTLDMALERVSSQISTELDELDREMSKRFNDSEYLHSFWVELESDIDYGEIGFSIVMRGELPTHLFKGEENTERFHEILESDYDWLTWKADSWIFDGLTMTEDWDEFDFIDGVGVGKEKIEIEGFKVSFEAWIEDFDEAEIYLQKALDLMMDVRRDWTEKNFIRGADIIYRKRVEPYILASPGS